VDPNRFEKILNLYAPLVWRSARTKTNMTPEQYSRLTSSIYGKAPARLLVFGCGLDSVLWSELNQGGQTVYLEDDLRWKQAGESAGLTVVEVHYESKLNVWLEDVRLPFGCTCSWMEVPWDIILVDGPLGVGAGPGREQSIYTAGYFRNKSGSLIYVHDYERDWERVCCDKYLGPPTSCLGNLASWDRKAEFQ
jgi:hypothetical protein